MASERASPTASSVITVTPATDNSRMKRHGSRRAEASQEGQPAPQNDHSNNECQYITDEQQRPNLGRAKCR
jgi:hypothetical protein